MGLISKLTFFLGLGFGTVISCIDAQGAPKFHVINAEEAELTHVRIIRAPADQGRLTELTVTNPDDLKVRTQGPKKDEGQLEVIFEGIYHKPNWALLLNGKLLRQTPKVGFSTWLPVTAQLSRLEITTIGPKGETLSEVVTIVFESEESFAAYQAFDPVANARKPPPKKFSGSAGLGFTLIQYTQSLIEDFSGISTTVKGGVNYALTKKWSLGISSFLNVFPIQRNRDEVDAKFLGINFRIGYFAFAKGSWGFSVNTGLYYITMLVTDERFGIKQMTGPQLFPVITHRFNSKNSAYMYAKFSPVGLLFGSLMDNRELAIGSGWNFKAFGRHWLQLGVDISNLKIAVGEFAVSSSTYSLGVSYLF